MQFLIDNQLPNELAIWLRDEGHEAVHVLDVQLAQAKDNPIWQRATVRQEIIVTKDEDFAEWVRRGRPGPQVLWIRLGKATSRQLIAWFAPLFPRASRELERGSRLVELR